MRKQRDFYDLTEQMFGPAAKLGLMYRKPEDHRLDGRTVRLDGRDCLHFGSCSYLGLELHPLVKQGAHEAIDRYGTQFSASRAAASCPLYEELEENLGRIFGLPALVAPTTALAHASALPLLVDERDVVILDQQVHASVRTATHHLVVQGTAVEMLRHNRLDLLEERLKALQGRYRRIWYMADGVYSMYGDLAPMGELAALLERYPALHLYVDDAHGMSWTGRHGRGHVLEILPFHERLFVATSLAKAFGVGGGVLVLPDEEARRRVRLLGSAFTFSGPLQPPSLGAAAASARLHLTGDLDAMQAGLQARIRLWNALCHEHGVPIVASNDGPIRFVAAGEQHVAYAVMERLLEEGIYPTLSIFPSVPMKRAGIRFALNLHQTDDDLQRAVEAVARHLPRELERAGSSLGELLETFGLGGTRASAALPASLLVLEHHRSIEALDPAEWDALLGANGTFSADGLRFLEEAFQGHVEPHHNWGFHYYVVRDVDGKPVLATFFTDALWKDDMLAPAAVSAELEQVRQADPYHLTSRTLGMGSLLSEGQHLYLDRTRDWRGALDLLFKALEAERRRCGATNVALRDLPAEDGELDAFLASRGFARFPMPESLVLDVTWEDDEAYLAGLSKNSRKHLRKKVLPFDGSFQLEVLARGSRQPSTQELLHLHGLYRAVAARNLDFNGFQLPPGIFDVLLRHPRWELLLLRREGEVVAFMAGYRGEAHYVPLFCGLDYRYVESHGSYRQMLRVAIQRAHAAGFKRMYWGIGATHEKERFGCVVRRQHVYVQTADAYNMEVVGQLLLGGTLRA